jgi:type IV pilus assembly protein PilC
MAKFNYQARTATGQITNGSIDASDESEARVKIRAKNMVPLRVSGMGPAGYKKAPVVRVSSRELQIFTRQLSTLVNAGIPIVDSLRMLGEGGRKDVLKDVAVKVRIGIESGRRLSDSLANFPGIFDRLYVNMVHAGEEAGILDGILNRLAIYMEKSEKIKKQVQGALVYPIAVVIIAILVISGIMVFIIPKFQELYTNSGKALPLLTQMVVNASQFMIHKYYVIFGVLLGGGFAFAQYARSPGGKDELDRILIRLPVAGELVQKSSLARMARTLSTLLTSGVSVINALEIASRTSGNRVIEEALIRAKESVTAGRPLATPLQREKMIPEMVIQMIAIGEKSGTMDVMFGKIADFYEDDIENAVRAMTSLIEPILMVGLGGAVAILVIAMYLPIFDMASLVGGH